MGSETLAIRGGTPVRTAPFPSWPVWDDSDGEALLGVLNSGQWGKTSGTVTEAFERAFADFQDAEGAVAVLNGSVALKIAVLSTGIEAGEEVIVPPYTFLATAMSVVECNALPVFADIELDSFCLSPAAFEAAITPRTRAVIPVHLGGQAADMEAICGIAERHGIAVIEDAAHAHGATCRGRKVGSIGDLGCFSFQSSKNLTSGEGGAITACDQDRIDACWSLHNCGRTRSGAWYGHEGLGSNCRLGEFQAALLLNQLTRLEAQTRRRDENGRYLNRCLAEIPGIRPLPRPTEGDIHAYHLYPFRFLKEEFGDGVSRSRFVRAVVAEGIPLGAGYTTPLYDQPVFRNRAFGPYSGWRLAPEPEQPVTCPTCEQVSRREGAWLSQHALLGSREDMDDIVEAMAKVHRLRGQLAETDEGA